MKTGFQDYKFFFFKFQASRADRFELENAKLREKLVDLEYLKARMDEVRTENGILAESKTELEEQLAMKEKQMEAMNQLEKDLLHFKQQIKTLSEVSRIHEARIQSFILWGRSIGFFILWGRA